MVEAIVAIAAGYAIGCLIAVAIMSAVMFSKNGIRWMYKKSKTIVDTMMEEEEAKQKEKEDDEWNDVLASMQESLRLVKFDED